MKKALSLKLMMVMLGFGSTVGLMLIFAWSIQAAVTASLSRQIGKSLALSAEHLCDKIDVVLLERQQDLASVANTIAALDHHSPERIRQSLVAATPSSAFIWLGFVRPGGALAASVGSEDMGRSISSQAWLGEAFAAQLTRMHLVALDTAAGEKRVPMIAVVMPVRTGDGGALIGLLDVARTVMPFLTTDRLRDAGFEALLALARDGQVLARPPTARAAQLTAAAVAPQARKIRVGSLGEVEAGGTRYLAGFSLGDPAHLAAQLDLLAIVRQEEQVAYAPLTEITRSNALLLAFFGLHALAFSWLIAAKLSAPLLAITKAANNLRKSEDARIPHLTQFAEVKVLSESLIGLVRELRQRQRSLVDLSASLEVTVAERTRALEERNASLAKATARAEQATEAKSRMLAAASHDLRQPLHALSLFCMALKRRLATSDSKALVLKIEQSLTSLRTMLDKLLHVARLDSGLIVASKSTVDMQELIGRIGTEFAIEADQRNLKFNFVSTSCVVETDPILLEIIIRNLVANAFKFTSRGGILLAARRRGGAVAIEVYDTGIGVTPDETARIFHEFERRKEDASGVNEGLGLGLSIVERHAALIGADVSVSSRVGHGSRFRVCLPVISARLPRDPPRPAIAHDSVRWLTILLVEDNIDQLAAQRQDLQDRGATVIALDNAAAALEALGDGLEIDAAVVDFDLGSDMTGLALIRECRRRGMLFPAMIVTGRTDAATATEARRSGVDFMQKPADPDLLASWLVRVARRGEPIRPADIHSARATS